MGGMESKSLRTPASGFLKAFELRHMALEKSHMSMWQMCSKANKCVPHDRQHEDILKVHQNPYFILCIAIQFTY